MSGNTKDNNTTTGGCTPLERCLSYAYCFLHTLVLNATLRLFAWPRVSTSPYLIFIVIGTRIAVGISWIVLHRYVAGEKQINPWVQNVVGLLPIFIVDLALGSCYRSCSVKYWVAEGFCSQV